MIDYNIEEENKDDEEEWINWNDILDDEDITSIKIEKAFRKK